MELVYIGRVEGNSNTIVYKYLDILTKEPYIFKKKIGTFSIGAIFECRKTENGIKGPYVYSDHEKNSDEVRKWINRDRAVYDEYLLVKSLSKKLHSRQDEAIWLLNKSYKELSPMQRLVFINRIILEITK